MLQSIFPAIMLIMAGMSSCTNQSTTEKGAFDSSIEIIDQAISAMGGNILDHAEINFDFRDQSLSYYNNNGQYRYTRVFPDTAGRTVTDTLTNEDFIRYIDGQKLELSDDRKETLQGGVNSIIYFAFLPYRLNDPSVISEYIDEVTIKGQSYDKIKVSFHNPEGDAAHNDVYYYYFDTGDADLEYLAYEFFEDGGGIRFRSAYNKRVIEGITIRDYINYGADPEVVDYSKIEEYYNNDELRELSRIELRNIEVKNLRSKS